MNRGTIRNNKEGRQMKPNSDEKVRVKNSTF